MSKVLCRTPPSKFASARPPGQETSILLVGADLSDGGGVNRVIRDMSSIFSRDLGIYTTVISARSGNKPSYGFSENVTLEFHPEGRTMLSYFRVLWKMRRRRYDYVVGFWPHDNIILAATFLFSRSKLILTEHTSWYFPSKAVRFLRRVMYRAAWRVIVLNEAELEYYKRFLHTVLLLPNAVPEIIPETLPAREKLILAVGHLCKRKNFEDAILAMAQSGLESEGWGLAIIGIGPDRAQLQQLINQLGLRRTEIHDPTDDIGLWYARASVLLVTSTLEVFSLVLVEAIQCGAVPVAYAADGPSFILKDFPDHLVQIGDVPGMAETMGTLARSSLLEDHSHHMRASVSERFSVSNVADQWRGVLL